MKKKTFKYNKNTKKWALTENVTYKSEYISNYDEFCRLRNDEKIQETIHNYYFVNTGVVIDFMNEIEQKTPVLPPPGYYNFDFDKYDQICYLEEETIYSDKYLELHSQINLDIEEYINDFFNNKEKYKDLGVMYKSGILMYGPPGTGKTCLIKHLVDKYSDKVRFLKIPIEYSTFIGLRKLKHEFTDIPTVFIFEEITNNLDSPLTVSLFLEFLDGIDTWNNALSIATTNYPEKLPINLVDRPSRFDKLFKIGFPDETVIYNFFKQTMNYELTDKEIKDLNGYSIAYLKSIYTRCKLKGFSVSDVIEEEKARKEAIRGDFKDSKHDETGKGIKKVGFADTDDM